MSTHATVYKYFNTSMIYVYILHQIPPQDLRFLQSVCLILRNASQISFQQRPLDLWVINNMIHIVYQMIYKLFLVCLFGRGGGEGGTSALTVNKIVNLSYAN